VIHFFNHELRGVKLFQRETSKRTLTVQTVQCSGASTADRKMRYPYLGKSIEINSLEILTFKRVVTALLLHDLSCLILVTQL
jgi:hypothetical protein